MAFNILNALCAAVLITDALWGLVVNLTSRKSMQAQQRPQHETLAHIANRWPPTKRWTLRVAGCSILLALILLALYLGNVPSFSYVDGKWVSRSADAWRFGFMVAVTLAALAMFFGRLIRLVANPRASLIRRLARLNAILLAAATAFLAFYCQLPRT